MCFLRKKLLKKLKFDGNIVVDNKKVHMLFGQAFDS